MNVSNLSNVPNRLPTPAEISRETLFLDAYGMTASNLLNDYPVDLSISIKKQDVLQPLSDKLAEDGWVYAGAGFFAAVFVKGGLALKIGFKVNDTGAMYAAWCRKNAGLAGVPEVFSITKFMGCYVVLTRRYDRLDRNLLDETSGNFVRSLSEEYDALRAAIHQGKFWGVGQFDTVKTAASIREFFEGVADFDLHEDNVMLDNVGDIIITDPISHGPCYTGGDSYYSETGYSTTR